MNDFLTQVQIVKPPFEITYRSNLFFIGSCFSDYIGKKMRELQFHVCTNPFGVIYNPLSIASNLELLVEKVCFTEDDLSFYNELWFSYTHYTLFSHPDKETCLRNINASFSEAKEFLFKADLLFITLGTSWIYRLRENGNVVANCHKQPASRFERSLLTVEQSYEALKLCIEKIRNINSDIKFVFTVSPIRHWKDGAIGNQRSKAALILAITELQDRLENIYYFPAYEIFMDELRDYRFYAADMLHPSESAQNYIWERFNESFISHDDMIILRNVEKIISSLEHKPRFPDTGAYRNFKQSVHKKIQELSKKFPFIDFHELQLRAENNV